MEETFKLKYSTLFLVHNLLHIVNSFIFKIIFFIFLKLAHKQAILLEIVKRLESRSYLRNLNRLKQLSIINQFLLYKLFSIIKRFNLYLLLLSIFKKNYCGKNYRRIILIYLHIISNDWQSSHSLSLSPRLPNPNHSYSYKASSQIYYPPLRLLSLL